MNYGHCCVSKNVYIKPTEKTLLHALERLARELFFLPYGQEFCIKSETSKQMIEKLAKTMQITNYIMSNFNAPTHT